ncbi:hypothetical protein [Clostridium sp. DJ247]|uniref:hypothetical protein n=1 Tax=Clostridium sp. DJ247 TaxID=2726188 RepID=UPI0016255164|nr:hypothetical protein [Clostridium sp. DJ247]MBC2581010.1 hypothetical protein [Clostridium sp. DJ247]
MRVITNIDHGKDIVLSIYETFIVEIPYNTSASEHLSGPSFQKIENCQLIKSFYVADNPNLPDSCGKMVYFMITSYPTTSLLYWFFSAPSYVSQFNFKLTVIPNNIN